MLIPVQKKTVKGPPPIQVKYFETKNPIDSKINKKSKLIHISTDEVFGDVIKGRSIEKDPYIPSSPYAASKAASDHLVSSYVRTYKINAIITIVNIIEVFKNNNV